MVQVLRIPNRIKRFKVGLSKRLILTALWSAFSFANQDQIQIDYQVAVTTIDKQAQEAITSSGVSESVRDLADRYFRFHQPLRIIFGGDEGPLYDTDQHQVLIPYSFYIESLNYFLEYAERAQTDAEQGALDTLLHTLLHEVGHAYIADHRLPVLGKEEDAVDNFAAIIMLNYIEYGDLAAINAADMFALESEGRPNYYQSYEYIGEHSFDLQRYFSTLCLVYGSDPEAHSELLNEIESELREERQQACIETFYEIDTNWKKMLSDHWLGANQPKL
ncbi:DUF4344 domain-containing metallopeptidase [Vibrio hippocampi]|uniref:Metallopeptidase DUF4344 n=1 Tax=Vibrio hippocampi TaxID=654686 RepID=A0ABM8ZPJ2_9VIBR|nr:DUF4344 domain-containing metallopeptidase [Vibrio hippocampi]CAH0530442.1 hypothetical protein VHP8226_04069 [Vibrio hippocampi]